MTDDEVAAVCDVARAQQRVVAAHARSAESIKMCVRHGVDVIYHATCADDEALDLLEAHKDRVFVAPALSVTVTRLRDAGKFGLPSSRRDPRADRRRSRADDRDDEGAEGARRARAARRRLRLHVESARQQRARPRVFRRPARLHADGSDRRRDAHGAARSWAWPDELGQVREGYLADLLLVDGDPLADHAIAARIARGCSRS